MILMAHMGHLGVGESGETGNLTTKHGDMVEYNKGIMWVQWDKKAPTSDTYISFFLVSYCLKTYVLLIKLLYVVAGVDLIFSICFLAWFSLWIVQQPYPSATYVH